ncbi:MAG: ABC transporter permease [Burkholderiales bacterium]|nr:ABC transporter permease [Burkholderiales bacterium]
MPRLPKIRATQQTIVFGLFLLLFLGFALFLPGFAKADNLLTMVQNVAILGILGLGMAVVVIGRGIDISMIASLAVPSGFLLQMVQNGHTVGSAALLSVGLALAFGLFNGWLIAYAEVPSLFATLASGLFLAGLGQAFIFQLEVVQWPSALDSLAWFGRGGIAGIPMPVVMFALASIVMAFLLRRVRAGAAIYAIGDNPLGARATGLPTRPLVVFEYVLASLIGLFAGVVMAASVSSMPTRVYNSTMIYDVVLVVVLGGIGLTGGRGGVTNVIIGTLLIGTMLNGMTILDISYSVQNIIKGSVLLVAILVDSLLNPRNEETAQQGDI